MEQQPTKPADHPKKQQAGSDSEWSLQSLEDLKPSNLKHLKLEQQHQQKPQKPQKVPQTIAPQQPTLHPSTPIHNIGKIICIVDQLLIVQSREHGLVIDLDNWLCEGGKQLVGWIIDVFGKVERPFYAVKCEWTKEKECEGKGLSELLLGKDLFYLEGNTKIINEDQIKSMKSKSAADIENFSQTSSEGDPEQQYQKQFTLNNNMMMNPKKANFNLVRPPKVHQNSMNEERQRTRDNRSNRFINNNNKHGNQNKDQRERNHSNQKYLQKMYSMHYGEMMRLQGMQGFQGGNMAMGSSMGNSIGMGSMGNPQMGDPQMGNVGMNGMNMGTMNNMAYPGSQQGQATYTNNMVPNMNPLFGIQYPQSFNPFTQQQPPQQLPQQHPSLFPNQQQTPPNLFNQQPQQKK